MGPDHIGNPGPNVVGILIHNSNAENVQNSSAVNTQPVAGEANMHEYAHALVMVDGKASNSQRDRIASAIARSMVVVPLTRDV